MPYLITTAIFRKKPILVIKKDDMKYSIKFGLTKAKIILDNIEEIRKFVDIEFEKDKPPTKPLTEA